MRSTTGSCYLQNTIQLLGFTLIDIAEFNVPIDCEVPVLQREIWFASRIAGFLSNSLTYLRWMGLVRQGHSICDLWIENYNALRDSVMTKSGDAGWGAVGMSLILKYFSPTTNLCIIRVARDHHRIAWGAVTFLSDINNIRVIPHVVHASGMDFGWASKVVL
ncbi:hypothetical protein AZE42_08764 [Rhizopogon vesiculosus]|uniref:Uncharacterized protein n=1 Tax=Rhizopogon vesiculosus TaxID=180088 RepID=A0A1J8PRF4_9AGAM|nr:hypothetical protein AZE42_08764 [Rhizopogon vesiculosus]